MEQDILKPLAVLAGWTMIMWIWMYATRIPAINKLQDVFSQVGAGCTAVQSPAAPQQPGCNNPATPKLDFPPSSLPPQLSSDVNLDLQQIPLVGSQSIG